MNTHRLSGASNLEGRQDLQQYQRGWSSWQIAVCVVGGLWVAFCLITVAGAWHPVFWPPEDHNGLYPSNYQQLVVYRAMEELFECVVLAAPAVAAISYAIYSSRLVVVHRSNGRPYVRRL